MRYKRGTVGTGRKHHEISEKTNRSYIPQNIKGTKINSQKFYSKKYDLVGIVDHAIITQDDIILVERKHTKQTKIYDTLRAQIGLLSLLLEENLQKPVTSTLVLFSYNQRHTHFKIDVDQKLKDYSIEMLEQARKVIDDGLMPESKYDARCVDCCYRKICDVGSLHDSI